MSTRAVPQPSRTQRTLAAVCGTLLAGALLILSGGNAITAIAATGDQPAPVAHESTD
ncbi:hypothetical protein [Demequina sp. NBRC 110056]|uniref:hypothetical protein n=1 Tax=Demequina sp. NBRC 110056 TaxID=1570345 RepID=UPI001356549B|nr:hypothetical protein [Demequina sp. NBRC 110056]